MNLNSSSNQQLDLYQNSASKQQKQFTVHNLLSHDQQSRTSIKQLQMMAGNKSSSMSLNSKSDSRQQDISGLNLTAYQQKMLKPTSRKTARKEAFDRTSKSTKRQVNNVLKLAEKSLIYQEQPKRTVQQTSKQGNFMMQTTGFIRSQEPMNDYQDEQYQIVSQK